MKIEFTSAERWKRTYQVRAEGRRTKQEPNKDLEKIKTWLCCAILNVGFELL